MEEDSFQNGEMSRDPTEDKVADMIEEYLDENLIQQEDVTVGERSTPTPSKRRRDSDEEELWTLITRDGKRYRARRSFTEEISCDQKIEVYLTAGAELPKQFAFARLMKENDILDILQIKHINPFKMFIQFGNEISLQKLISSQPAQANNWRIIRTNEVGTTYGVIKNVEQDLKDEEIIKSITCDAELLSVKRLTRRTDDGLGWTECESVRLCFKGPTLPSFVSVHGMRVRVEKYVFPVTQCSNCWKFGHSRKMCPRKKTVCPKCSKNHENCEATTFVCVNCTGDHLALSKKCPVYIKERKIRYIMADSNCTYRNAMAMYVPEMSSPQPKEPVNNYQGIPNVVIEEGSMEGLPTAQPAPSYASILKNATPTTSKKNASQDHHFEKNETEKKKKTRKKGPKRTPTPPNSNLYKENEERSFDWDGCTDSDGDNNNMEKKFEEEKSNNKKKRKKLDREGNMTLEKFLELMKNVLFEEDNTFIEKFKAVAKIGLKWLLEFLAKHFYDLPFIKPFMVYDG